jgi:3',5'-cyclic AMP phosphodiesterase CpdA
MPTDPHCWALLSDPHIAADRALVVRDVRPAERLSDAVIGVLALPDALAGVIVNGDCAYDAGTPGDYAVCADLLAPLAAAGLPVHLTLGNHDDRANFLAVLGDPDAASPVPGRHVTVVSAEGADLFLLDTLDQPDIIPGRLGPDQLAWLARELDARPDQPALVFGHHNLDPVPLPEGEPPIGLLDTAELLAVLRPRRQVKAYVHGHTHTWGVAVDPSGLHVVSLPPVSSPLQAGDPAGWVRMHLRPEGARLVLHGLGPVHPAHGQTVDLAWRPG